MTITQIAAAISAHLARWEAHPRINAPWPPRNGTRPYYCAPAYAAGSRVFVSAGPLVKGRFTRDTQKGELLPGGATSYAGLSGCAIRVMAGAQTVLAGVMP